MGPASSKEQDTHSAPSCLPGQLMRASTGDTTHDRAIQRLTDSVSGSVDLRAGWVQLMGVAGHESLHLIRKVASQSLCSPMGLSFLRGFSQWHYSSRWPPTARKPKLTAVHMDQDTGKTCLIQSKSSIDSRQIPWH
jgi:hypothetical protein